MRLSLNVFVTLVACQLSLAFGSNLVCFYDASSIDRDGLAKFSTADLETALQFCTHLIYGYAGISSDNFRLMSLNTQRDVQRHHYNVVTQFKQKFPHIKFLLSVGGDRDLQNPEKYVKLLEGGTDKYKAFAESARDLLRIYNFDGLDLAFQLPRNKPRKVHSGVGQIIKKLKKKFSPGDEIVDEKAAEHKQQFTNLVTTLRSTFNPYKFMISLTVLPNVNSTWYFDVPALASKVDFVNLAAFDFTTPERNPEEADYTAPLFPVELKGNRLPHYNVEYQVDYWISNYFPHNRLNVGIATYGRAWKMTSDSNANGEPVVSETENAAEPGPQTKQVGLYKWSEICLKMPGRFGAEATLRGVRDRTQKHGSYAFRPADKNGKNGLWISYEDLDTASTKAAYVTNRGLGGVALFDLSLDDFNGQCTGDRFPMLRAIKYQLL